jgi:hypothetical protein
MRLLPSDPDVQTIVARINNGDIDLQPEFQRGEVWGKFKKQRLIDSILRDWHVPPIHVIQNSQTGKQEVLDGQQRLASIRDFVDNQFPIDGSTPPLDGEIESLNGKYYRDLSGDWRRRFNQFTIRIFRIVDYRSGEPAELFFRLNQPTSLTAAEQRNAFFGPVREQIKDMVETLVERDLDKTFFGFSNSRMAYDDVLARTALAVERRSISEKITSSDLTDLYRADKPLRGRTLSVIHKGIDKLAEARSTILEWPKFNKATTFSWLIFLVRPELQDIAEPSTQSLANFLSFFEQYRKGPSQWAEGLPLDISGASASHLIRIYENRSSSRVADVSSVILRDAVLWRMYDEFCAQSGSLRHLQPLGLGRLREAFGFDKDSSDDDVVARKLLELGWGHLG